MEPQDNKTEIQPVTIPTKGIGIYFFIRVVTYVLGATEAMFYWAVKNQDDVIIIEGNVTMTSPELDNWGTDDNYVIDWALNELNFTKA